MYIFHIVNGEWRWKLCQKIYFAFPALNMMIVNRDRKCQKMHEAIYLLNGMNVNIYFSCMMICNHNNDESRQSFHLNIIRNTNEFNFEYWKLLKCRMIYLFDEIFSIFQNAQILFICYRVSQTHYTHKCEVFNRNCLD